MRIQPRPHIAGLFLGLVVCFAQTIKPNQIEDADGLRTDQEDLHGEIHAPTKS